jgi:hypothetical protein
MADNQFEEKSWEQKNKEATEIMAQQEAELDVSRQAEAQQKAEATEQSPEEVEGARAQRFSQTRAAEQARLANAPTPQPDEANAGPALAKIDAQIASLAQKKSSSWMRTYLFLLVGAAVVDILQFAANMTFLLAWAASGIGLIFSFVRYFALRAENRSVNDNRLSKGMVTRTLISGAVSMVPIVDLLPEQTMAMIKEWNVRKLVAQEASADEKKLWEERKKIAGYVQN